MSASPQRKRVVVIVGSTSRTSRTRSLAKAIVEGLQARAPFDVQWLELRELAPHVGAAISRESLDATGSAALDAIESADLVVAASPVYKGSYTGLFKHLLDFVHPDALVDRPVLLAATGGSDRHALVVDHQLRPLFAFFRARTVPSAVYATESDFDGDAIRSAALAERVGEAVGQAVALVHQAGLNQPVLRAVA